MKSVASVVPALRALGAAALVAGLAAPAALAADAAYPKFRPGLWEFVRAPVNAPPNTPKYSARECDDPTKSMIEQAAQMQKTGCKLQPPKREGKSYRFGSVCEIPGAGKTKSTTLLMRESDRAYTAMLETHGQMGGKPVDASEVITARWLGECPKK